jgi:phosphomannomutase/phosphoglucomutase
MTSMNPAIFREYDIRGLAERDFDRDFAEILGRIHGTDVKNRGGSRVAVGRDCRSTSDRYAEAVIQGLLSAGLHVYDIGVCPSPLLYFSLFHLDLDGGVQVTASHNPSEYNGFKVCMGKETLYGSQIQELRRKIEKRECKEKPGGKRESYAIIPPYQEHLLGDVPALARPLRVVVDAGQRCGRSCRSADLPSFEIYRVGDCLCSRRQLPASSSGPHGA